MAIETELKLRFTPAHLAKLKRHALLKEHQLARAGTKRLYNVYFDTPELDLHRAMMALRLRRKGRQWLQTLKGGGAIKGRLHLRNEWEVPVRGEALDFSAAVTAEWDELLPVAWREKLQPLFVTDFMRSTREVVWQGAHIEVCMDHGQISGGGRMHEICELELELKSGEPQQLFGLALAILDVVPFEIEMVNKAEYGFRLLSGTTEQPHKSVVPLLDPKRGLADGLQAALSACLLQWQRNWRGALVGEEDEFLHQVRVALRRMRVLLHLMQQLRDDETLGCFTAELADLSLLLGQVRDWDVFIDQTLRPLYPKPLKRDGSAALWEASKDARGVCHAALCAVAPDVQNLMLRFAQWMYSDYWKRLEMDERHVRDLAAHRLNKQTHHLALQVARTDGRDAYQLHELRIMAKKLRYSAEFFAAWFDAKHTVAFLHALSAVQQELGQINDATIAYRLLDELAVDTKAAHRVRDAVTVDMHERFVALVLALKHYDKQKIFWRV
jgi:triphosphatase